MLSPINDQFAEEEQADSSLTSFPAPHPQSPKEYQQLLSSYHDHDKEKDLEQHHNRVQCQQRIFFTLLILTSLFCLGYFLIVPLILGKIINDAPFVITQVNMLNSSSTSAGNSTRLEVEGVLHAAIPFAAQASLDNAHLDVIYSESRLGNP